MQPIERVLTEVDRATEEIVQLTADLVRIPTINPPGEDYEACAHFLGDFLKRRAFEIEYVAADGRPEHTPRFPRVNVMPRGAAVLDHLFTSMVTSTSFRRETAGRSIRSAASCATGRSSGAASAT